jgi:hypothetical protein
MVDDFGVGFMRRLPLIFGFTALFIGTTQLTLLAEPPHLELVRGLRKEGMTDLAWEYLEKLKSSTDPRIKELIPLESARTRLDFAAQESDDNQRSAMLIKAKEEFNQFLKAHPKHPLASVAQVEVARLTSLQGKQHLIKARRAESKESATSERKNARPFFEEAAKGYQSAAKLLDADLKKYDADSSANGKDLGKAIRDAKLRTELDRAINLYDLGQTYNRGGDAKELQERGKWINDAKKIFAEVGYRDLELPQAWIARAWEAQCSYETQTGSSDSEFQALFSQRTPVAIAGIRLGKAFIVQHTFADEGLKNRYASARQKGIEWLKEFPTAKNSPEGLTVRFIIARSTQLDAESEITRDKTTGSALKIGPLAIQKLREAETIYHDITDTENEFSDRANRFRMQCILDRTDAIRDKSAGETLPENLKNFDEAFLQAIVTQARIPGVLAKLGKDMDQDLKNAPEQGRDDREAKWKGKFKKAEEDQWQRIIGYIDRALDIATSKDSAKEIADAQVLRIYGYSMLHQPQITAVLAEHFLRSHPNSRQAPKMGQIAVNSYVVSLNQLRRLETQDNTKRPQDIQADSKRVKAVAQLLESNYSQDPATDSVRHDLGYLLSIEKNYPESLQIYLRIQPSYSLISRARMEQGATLFVLLRNELDSSARGNWAEETQKVIQKYNTFWKRTIADLESLIPPAAGEDEAIVEGYARAKIQLAQLYQLEGKQYERMEEVSRALAEYLPKCLQLPEKERQDLTFTAQAMRLIGIYGRAFILMKVKDPGYLQKVDLLLNPVIEEFRKTAEMIPEERTPGFERMRRAQKDVIITALRASVQQSNIERAKELLELLQKAKSDTEDTTQVLQQLVNAIRSQIDGLKLEKKKEDAEALTRGFSEFLETIAKQTATEKPKNPEDEVKLNARKLFLARGFGDVDQYAKAVELLEGIQKGIGEVDPKDKEKQKFKLQVQYALARNARLAGDFKRAEEMLNQLIGTNKKKEIGYGIPEVRKERAYLLEDQKKFRDAVTEWQNLSRGFVGSLPGIPREPSADDTPEERQKLQNDRRDAIRKRELYFDLFFEANRCSAKAYSQLPEEEKYIKLRDEGYDKVAKKFAELETNTDLKLELIEKIREFMDQYPQVKAKYKASGGKLFGSEPNKNER